jgi:hypothetical protein
MIPKGERIYLPQDEGWMSVECLDQLYEAAEETKRLEGQVLELGCWKGLSASALTLAGPVVCVDWFRGNPLHRGATGLSTYDSLADFTRNMRSLGRAGLVRLLPTTTREALGELAEEGFRARLVLIDASHREEDVYADLVGVWPMLVTGGYVFIDDADWDEVNRARLRFERGTGVKFYGEPRDRKLTWVVKP